jgi:transglutaminase-like putative cysteine protease
MSTTSDRGALALSRFVSGGLGLALAALAAAPALAADKPAFGPPPAWVDVAPIPDTAPSDIAATQALLDDNQARLGPDGDTTYNRRVERVLKPEGLRGLTSFGVTWDPETESVTFHRLAIIRDGKAIDLLDGGKHMLVIRREKDLEHAMLDGRLTANQQLEGIQVGDVLDVAWSMTRKEPLFGGRSYDVEGMSFHGVASRFRVRISWPDDDPVRWKANPGFGDPRITHKAGRTFLDLDLKDAAAPKPPIGAPLRFRRLGSMEVSSFASWADVSKIMAPLFQKASTLSADSPLKAEAAAIAARTTDPKARAFAALELVEEKTRYFFLGIGDGGYVPAQAEETWARRFGDCKAKTALLLSLLHELGIEAEPALVSLGAGDGMDERLPSAAAFNHVIVRATIDGKVYWLDGTRSGDRAGLDALRPPPHHWALPLRTEGASLERIVVPPPTEPLIETSTRFDASKGVDEPAPVEVTMRYRGDRAIAMRRMVATASRADVERNLRQSLSRSMSWVEVESISWKDDLAHDAFELRLTGKADLDWRKNPDVGALEYRVSVGGRASGYPRREPGLNRDAPFAVSYPNYVKTTTEFVLPQGGRGFMVRGPNDQETVGGFELKRASELKDGIARFSNELRSIVPEIPAAEAAAATRKLRLLNQDDTLIRAPVTAVVEAAARPAS